MINNNYHLIKRDLRVIIIKNFIVFANYFHITSTIFIIVQKILTIIFQN